MALVRPKGKRAQYKQSTEKHRDEETKETKEKGERRGEREFLALEKPESVS